MLRFFHRILAFILGKFWAHCPHCNEFFGGHQGHKEHVMIGKVSYRYVCKPCAIEHKL